MLRGPSRGAWRELELKLRPFILRRLRSEADTDDVLQEVFLRLHRGLSALRDEESFGGWAYQIARSAIVDHLRSSAKHGADARAAEASEASPPEPEEGDFTAREELAGCLAPFIAGLPVRYREALVLSELQGVPQKEAAELLGISVSGMKSRVQRGRLLMRKALNDCCHIALDVRGKVLAFEARADGGAEARSPDDCCDRGAERLRPWLSGSVLTGMESNESPKMLPMSPTADGQPAAAWVSVGHEELAACCVPEKKATCCVPAAKESCCGPTLEGSNGCC